MSVGKLFAVKNRRSRRVLGKDRLWLCDASKVRMLSKISLEA